MSEKLHMTIFPATEKSSSKKQCMFGSNLRIPAPEILVTDGYKTRVENSFLKNGRRCAGQQFELLQI